MKQRKCNAKDCKRKVEYPYLYCSFECAIYDGKFNVNTGWKDDKLKNRNG
jgi:hypothetical protein